MSEDSKNKQANGEKQEQMLDEHKKMLIMTGKLSDFQLENLKSWPFVLFEGVETVTINYDFTEDFDPDKEEDDEALCAGAVQFNVKLTESPDKDKIEHLKNWTKFLFWKDTRVTVKFDLVV